MLCSFKKCRLDGIKFLYCKFCKDAVGKRVFRNQHHHMDDNQVAQVIARNHHSTTTTTNTSTTASNTVHNGDSGRNTTPSEVAEIETILPIEQQEEGRKIIPCLATGMAAEHDFKVSYSFSSMEIQSF